MAFNRYSYSRVTHDKDKKFRKINTTLYPKIEASDDDEFILTKVGDRLDLLAFQYYGDVELWWVISQANDIEPGTLNVVPGIQLRIPQNLESIYSDLETINRAR